MNAPEAIRRKLTGLDLKIDLLTKRMFAYVTFWGSGFTFAGT